MNVYGQYIIFFKFDKLAAILNILAYFRQTHPEMRVYAPVTLSRIPWRFSENAVDMCNTNVSANHRE